MQYNVTTVPQKGLYEAKDFFLKKPGGWLMTFLTGEIKSMKWYTAQTLGATQDKDKWRC